MNCLRCREQMKVMSDNIEWCQHCGAVLERNWNNGLAAANKYSYPEVHEEILQILLNRSKVSLDQSNPMKVRI